MAKTVIVGEDKTITINPKSKSTTYAYGNEGIALTFDGGFISDKGKEIVGYYDTYYNFATKSKNDLVITTLFTTDSGKAKTVTTTVKDFFTDSTKNYILKYKTYFPNMNGYSESTIKPDTEYGTNGLYYETGVENNISYMLGSNKNDTEVLLNGLYSNYIYDPKGKDEYVSRHSNVRDYIWDIKGNDKYTVDVFELTSGGILRTYDYSGDDEYYALGSNSRLYSTDYSGNDEYDLELGSKFWIDDYKGNDEYIVDKNSMTADEYNRRINDYKGNDEYKLYNKVNVDIVDCSGKDEYKIENLTNSDEVKNHVEISDNGKGNDTIEIKDCKDLTYNNFYVSNASGNETYKLENVTFSQESYQSAITNNQYAIIDENGNDRYKLRNVENINMSDKGGKDYYDLKGDYDANSAILPVKNFQITDNGAQNDKYDIQFAVCEYKDNDKTSRTIMDENGKDTYNIAATSSIRINDKSGNDTYNLKAPTNSKGKKIEFGDSETFSLLNVATEIYDDKGDDKYNISYLMNGNIVDCEGVDTYNIKGSPLSYQLGSGDDAIKGVIPSVLMSAIHDANSTSSDTYNISNATGFPMALGGVSPLITDDGGDNKFNIKNSGNYVNLKELLEAKKNNNTAKIISIMYTVPTFEIKCTGFGNDKYNVSDSTLLTTLSDNQGADKYNFKNVSGTLMIKDASGDDKYTISKNKASISITDNSGDDIYTLSNLSKAKLETSIYTPEVTINDKLGNDTLKITSLNKSNIVYMANFSCDVDENYISDSLGLIIYDKKNGGFVNLVDFYRMDESSITGFGDGVIETLRAGKSSIKLKETSDCNFNKMENLREQIGAWLSDAGRNYDDVSTALTSGDDVSELIQIFQSAQ